MAEKQLPGLGNLALCYKKNLSSHCTLTEYSSVDRYTSFRLGSGTRVHATLTRISLVTSCTLTEYSSVYRYTSFRLGSGTGVHATLTRISLVTGCTLTEYSSVDRYTSFRLGRGTAVPCTSEKLRVALFSFDIFYVKGREQFS
ncbi:hypothetical protein J6590_069764 [Homalodisca vitripennis]|nr:hypothetical protein J6590_069764 [Homalodisca vitripennis]